MIIKFECIVRSKENHATHKRFKTYAVKADKDKFGQQWVDTRFTKDVADADKPQAYSELYVNEEDITIDRRNKYPVVWIKKILKCIPLERPHEDLTQYFETCDEI